MCQAIICSLYFLASSKTQTLSQFLLSFIFVNSESKIRCRERRRLTNSGTAHAWSDIPWNLNVFKRSTERKNILFHVLSKRQQKAQRWRKDVVQNSEFLAYMFIYEMLLVYINCFHSGQRNRKLEFQFWIKTRCNRMDRLLFVKSELFDIFLLLFCLDFRDNPKMSVYSKS